MAGYVDDPKCKFYNLHVVPTPSYWLASRCFWDSLAEKAAKIMISGWTLLASLFVSLGVYGTVASISLAIGLWLEVKAGKQHQRREAIRQIRVAYYDRLWGIVYPDLVALGVPPPPIYFAQIQKLLKEVAEMQARKKGSS